MRLSWLEDILAVLETGSFQQAAELRFLTPSAFTRRIKTIETTLDCELFDRHKKPVVLHPHALQCIPEIRDAVNTLKQLKLRLSQPASYANRQVTMICQHVLATSIAPRLVKLAADINLLSVRIKSGNQHDCLVELIKRDAQFAMIYELKTDPPTLNSDSSERMLLGDDRLIPIATPALCALIHPNVTTENLPLIRYPAGAFLGDTQRRLLLTQLEPSVQWVTVAESGLVPAVAEFVRHGIGIGWLPVSLIKADLANGTLCSLEASLPSCELNISLFRLNNSSSVYADQFWTLMSNSLSIRPTPSTPLPLKPSRN